MRHSLLFFFILLPSQQGLAGEACVKINPPSQLLGNDLVKHQCLETKHSPRCQELYESIREAGNSVEDKALHCDVDHDLSTFQKIAVSFISCLKGGIVDGMITPIQDIGTLIGEGTAKAVLNLQADSARQKYCDQNPEVKKQIYEIYNKSVPKLLRLQVPRNIESQSCAQIEQALTLESSRVLRNVSNDLDPKYGQYLKSIADEKTPTQNRRTSVRRKPLNPDELEFLSWRFGFLSELAPKEDKSLSDYADQLLESYNIRSDCYNLATRTALRCEILFHGATLGAGLAAGSLAIISGVKVSRFTESVAALQAQPGGLRAATSNQKINLFMLSNKLTDSQRIKAAESLLGRSLSPTEAKALIDAHHLPLSDLRQKASVLKKGGFGPSERDLMMRTGLSGEFDDFIQKALAAERTSLQNETKIYSLEHELFSERRQLNMPGLDSTRKAEIEARMKRLSSQLDDARTAQFSVFGPKDLERQIGHTSREIDIMKANDFRIPSYLYERRATLFRESAELNAAGGSYAAAREAYSQSATDIKKALISGGLTSFRNQVDALRTLKIAGVNTNDKLYLELLDKVARSPTVSSLSVKIDSLPFSEVIFNAEVLKFQKGSAWELARRYHEQLVRVELQSQRNEIRAGARWESIPRLSNQMEAMQEQANRLREEAITALKKGGASRDQIQKRMTELELQLPVF